MAQSKQTKTITNRAPQADRPPSDDAAARLPFPAIAKSLPICGPEFARPDPDLIKRLAGVSSATASAIMHRMGVRQTFIAGSLPRQRGVKAIGPVVTLQFLP